MLSWENRKINHGDHVIIGLGDSFTEGRGALSDKTYESINYKLNPWKLTVDLLREMKSNSWVNQLAKLRGAVPFNFGMAGIGNRAAIKSLYIENLNLDHAGSVTVIFMTAGLERFDFSSREANTDYPFCCMWPNYWQKDHPHIKLWEAYADHVYSDDMIRSEFFLNIKELEMYCAAKNYNFYVFNAYDTRINKNFFKESSFISDKFLKEIPWDKFLTLGKYQTVMEMLCDLEGKPDLHTGGYWEHFSKLKKGSRYITQCCHPTVLGHELLAKEINESINESINSPKEYVVNAF